MQLVKLDGSDWPTIVVDVRCDSCDRVITSEVIRPVTLAKFPSVAWYWRDRIMAHLEGCPGKPKTTRGDA